MKQAPLPKAGMNRWLGLSLLSLLLAALSPGWLRNWVLHAAIQWTHGLAPGLTLIPEQLADNLHGVIYGVFGLSLYLSFGLGWAWWLGAEALAVSTEVVQHWIPGRYPSVSDALINTTTLFLGLVLGIALERLSRSWRQTD